MRRPTTTWRPAEMATPARSAPERELVYNRLPLLRANRGISRNELERLISLYHVARQQAGGFQLCCDAETREHCGCDGWNMFDNAFLEKTYKDLTGRDAIVA